MAVDTKSMRQLIDAAPDDRMAMDTRDDFFSVVHAGLHYVHMIAGPGQIIAGASGKVAVPIWPMLRFISTDGDVCHFDDPMIEGQLVGFDKGASFELNRTEPVSFSIQERQ